jgi:hypothetical protein
VGQINLGKSGCYADERLEPLADEPSAQELKAVKKAVRRDLWTNKET